LAKETVCGLLILQTPCCWIEEKEGDPLKRREETKLHGRDWRKVEGKKKSEERHENGRVENRDE